MCFGNFEKKNITVRVDVCKWNEARKRSVYFPNKRCCFLRFKYHSRLHAWRRHCFGRELIISSSRFYPPTGRRRAVGNRVRKILNEHVRYQLLLLAYTKPGQRTVAAKTFDRFLLAIGHSSVHK